MKKFMAGVSAFAPWAVVGIGLIGCAVPRPRLHPEPGLYICPEQVTITDERHHDHDEHTKIFYTTDGGTPTQSSPQYAGPFLIGNTATVKAIARVEDDNSKVKSGTYTCRPDVNRADMAILLQQNFSLPSPVHTVSFADVHSGELIYPAAQALAPFMHRQVLCPICLLSANFSPQRPTSRAESAIMLVSILIAAQRIQLSSASDSNTVLSGVPDTANLPPVARRYVATAIQNGLLSLEAGNTFQPAQPYSRSELAAALSTIRTRFGTVVVPRQ